MSLRRYPNRLFLAAALFSLLILGLSGTVAVSLIREQARTAEELSEDVRSKRETADLEESLGNLIVLHQRGVSGLRPLQERIEEHLRQIHRLANKPQEKEFAAALEKSYRTYLVKLKQDQDALAWRERIVAHLRDDTLPTCQQLRNFNAIEIEESEQNHRLSLERMAWGLAVVGGLASVGGMVLGYALARSLQQTIHQFLLRVQGAADRLGQELPAVEWHREGSLMQDGADELIYRVEQAVLRLQQQEREVQHAEQLAAIGQLAAGVAHEIRNPLTSAILLIQTGRHDPAAGGLNDEDLDLIESELQRIESTLQLFLDFARPPRLTRSPCELGVVVRTALGLIRGRTEQQHVRVSLHVPERGCVINIDAEQVRQVILNLLLNALDVMPNGGTLRLETRFPGDGQELELAVQDTGPGIAPSILPRLFQPFATGKETGLGLGLVVSQRIAEAHGGTLTGHNRAEGGACFLLRLPRSETPLLTRDAPTQLEPTTST
ncbi:MAG: ATP-binding protein [Gemmataceae bacterium]